MKHIYYYICKTNLQAFYRMITRNRCKVSAYRTNWSSGIVIRLLFHLFSYASGFVCIPCILAAFYLYVSRSKNCTSVFISRMYLILTYILGFSLSANATLFLTNVFLDVQGLQSRHIVCQLGEMQAQITFVWYH